MEKPTIIKFDREAYEEYQELQKAVLEGHKAKKKPTYEQLLIIGDEVKIIAFVLEYMDHKKYNKIFGYKKK